MILRKKGIVTLNHPTHKVTCIAGSMNRTPTNKRTVTVNIGIATLKGTPQLPQLYLTKWL
ncbi:MAG: hypothetical protein A2042_04610 [Candidatus Schekmanbacteria bacterium GWA2_38_11]|uniref:Uncharacterized protein n=1 Tax=Candidatus Schekmanbacteria bacterium GWA2_38_11 TaxID=1817876 RepID=A0A1F7RN67_9BACT|nr:MAG: hypothetical protein A2042_04610 [Candidatus Schekmanbacteria bacterium GWA2_38_11]